MEAEGLIDRLADSKDVRRSLVKLTPEGLRLFLQLHERAHDFEESLTSAISQEDIATTVKVLSQLQRGLGKMH